MHLPLVLGKGLAATRLSRRQAYVPQRTHAGTHFGDARSNVESVLGKERGARKAKRQVTYIIACLEGKVVRAFSPIPTSGENA